MKVNRFYKLLIKQGDRIKVFAFTAFTELNQTLHPVKPDFTPS